MAPEREHLSWDGFGQASRDLARAIVADDFIPEVVVAIARGGLLPAGAIAYGLGIKNCGAINVEFYTGIGTVLDAPELLPPAVRDYSVPQGEKQNARQFTGEAALSLKAYLRRKGKEYIEQVLAANGFNREKAAALLRVNPVTLYRRLKDEDE